VAYFKNQEDALKLDAQCAKCKYGFDMCPISFVQETFNADAYGNDTATQILNELITSAGRCRMFITFEEDFKK
jgi:hypothetical protein